MTKFYLMPTGEQNQKSFYGKAYFEQYENGEQVLFSYDTPILKRTASGEIFRIWNKWSLTTGKHIKAFCGLDKKQFEKLPFAG